MDVQPKNCKLCGRLFAYVGGQKICPDCRKKLDALYERSRRFIRDNPDMALNVTDLSDAMDVERMWIQKLVDDGRLNLGNASGELVCESCGAAIETGTLCDRCRARLNLDLSRSKKSKSAKMYTQERLYRKRG